MYRDGAIQLDEHDRAVGAIEIADGLIARCLLASKQLASAEHRWRAVREIHDNYTELWQQLDTARRLLAARGVNTIGYDELRGEVVAVLPLRDDGIDTTPLEDARRAIAELRMAIPGADWKAIEARTRGLASGQRLVKGGQRLAFLGVAVVFAAAVATWAASTIPGERVDPRAEARLEMKRELAVVVEDRKDRIDQLALLIGGRCDRTNVREYVKLLVKDGRFGDAYAYGADFIAQCGEDAEVRTWSRMAKKKHDRLSQR